MDSAKFGTACFSEARFSVYITDWDRLKNRLKRIGGITTDLTRRVLKLGARDSTTGHRVKDFDTTFTIEGVLLDRGSQYLAVSVGTYVRTDALLLTADGVSLGDEILTKNLQYYAVKGKRDYHVGDSFSYREVDLTLLPMHT